MTYGITSITTAALGLALDAASLRQQAAAANIANAGAIGYAPVQVAFEDRLEDARAALRDRGAVDAASLADAAPRLELVPASATGAPPGVQLDAEVARMAQNATHFQALLKAVSRHLAVLSLAVSDGRR
jgi:flagellar basal-body rod protein FlgB